MLLPSPLEQLHLSLFEEKKVEVWIKRDDLIHDEISGNKWRKLKYNVQTFQEGNYDTILTFGGAYSNHILATAKVGFDFKIPTIGIIRGEEQLPLNPTLARAKELGMQLHYSSRTEYKEKDNPTYLQQLQQQFGAIYIIPEGGGNTQGVLGCKDILSEIKTNFNYIVTDCGTGATLAGLAVGLKKHQKAIGIPVLKGGEFILQEVKKYYQLMEVNLAQIEQIDLATDYHFGGYAKYKPELLEFMRSFYLQTGIKTDPVYTGKLCYGVLDLIAKDYFPPQSKIIILHTGGFQGIAGFEKRYKIKIY